MSFRRRSVRPRRGRTGRRPGARRRGSAPSSATRRPRLPGCSRAPRPLLQARRNEERREVMTAPCETRDTRILAGSESTRILAKRPEFVWMHTIAYASPTTDNAGKGAGHRWAEARTSPQTSPPSPDRRRQDHRTSRTIAPRLPATGGRPRPLAPNRSRRCGGHSRPLNQFPPEAPRLPRPTPEVSTRSRASSRRLLRAAIGVFGATHGVPFRRSPQVSAER